MNSHGTCAFCDNQAKYNCPKCNCEYCSLNCYKSEGHKSCSEKFYKANIEEEMSKQRADEEDKIKLAKVVKKYNIGQGPDDWKYEIPESVEKEYRQYASQNMNSELTGEEEKELEKLVDEASFEKLWDLLNDEDRLDFIKRFGDPKQGD
jgi:hypothetical protein